MLLALENAYARVFFFHENTAEKHFQVSSHFGAGPVSFFSVLEDPEFLRNKAGQPSADFVLSKCKPFLVFQREIFTNY